MANFYTQQAEECLKAANQLITPEQQSAYLALAQVYATLGLAEEQRTANVLAFTKLIETPVDNDTPIQFDTRRALRDTLDLHDKVRS